MKKEDFWEFSYYPGLPVKLNSLDEKQKQMIYEDWMKKVWTDRVQTIDQKLSNIKQTPQINVNGVTKIINSKEKEILEDIQNTRNSYIHLSNIHDETKLNKDAIRVLNRLVEYLNAHKPFFPILLESVVFSNDKKSSGKTQKAKNYREL